MTDVVAALIWDGDRFLACQRPEHKARGLLWEFVGGKVDHGETKQEALIRECKEELDVTVSVGECFMELLHEYPDLTVRLTLFNAQIINGTPRMLEHNDIRWITTNQIDNYTFCPADKNILEELKKLSNGFQAQLYSLRDLEYRTFQQKLIPSIPGEKILGVRIPLLRSFAKDLQCLPDLGPLPHRFFEEDCLHGILISNMTDANSAIQGLNTFLPYVDNWAVCDLISPKAFAKRPAGLITHVMRWISSGHTYTVRYGIGVLMKYYLDDAFRPEYLELVAQIHSEEYYVRMMIAWYFATALAKQYDQSVKHLQNNTLDVWTHNKTIQKACESYRLDGSKKAYLRTLKRREEHCT